MNYIERMLSFEIDFQGQWAISWCSQSKSLSASDIWGHSHVPQSSNCFFCSTQKRKRIVFELWRQSGDLAVVCTGMLVQKGTEPLSTFFIYWEGTWFLILLYSCIRLAFGVITVASQVKVFCMWSLHVSMWLFYGYLGIFPQPENFFDRLTRCNKKKCAWLSVCVWRRDELLTCSGSTPPSSRKHPASPKVRRREWKYG